MDDTIKRSDAIKAFRSTVARCDPLLNGINMTLPLVEIALRLVPSADRPQGEWIEDPINKNNMYCSNCKVSYTKDFLRGMSLYHEPKDMPNFCPNCGANVTKGNTPILQELLSGLVGEEWKAKR